MEAFDLKRKIDWIFIALFFVLMAIPICTVNLKKNTVSESENRRLAPFPSFLCEDGSINRHFTNDFEAWINDNIGMRASLVLQNARIQFRCFDVLSNNSDMVIGPNGEFNYATDAIIRSYQHFDLKSEETLRQMADGYQYMFDFTKRRGIQLYYFQCWDKQSVYPEQFPTTVIQHGSVSKTDQIVNNLTENTDIPVISPKQKLIDAKSTYSTYGKWTDPTHWTQRGAYIGYTELMHTINAHNGNKYTVLTEDDYNIKTKDCGKTLFGGIHKEDYVETFEIKSPSAILTNEKLTLYSDDERHRFFTNHNAGNRDRVLVLGDSYVNSFILDDLAESFYETLIIWGDYTRNVGKIIDAYHPDILIVENAERCDRTDAFVSGSQAVKEAELAAAGRQ